MIKLFPFLLLLTAAAFAADRDSGSKCVSTNSHELLVIKDVRVADMHLLEEYPIAIPAHDGKPAKLEWLPAGSLKVESDMMAVVNGKMIHRFVFWTEDGGKM